MTAYKGSGTHEDPFLVSYDEPFDAHNAMQFGLPRKYFAMLAVAYSMMAGTFSVSSYTAGYSFMARGTLSGRSIRWLSAVRLRLQS
jgi:hypothetical protein